VCPLRIELRLEELDRSAVFEGHDIKAKFPQPSLDFACARSISKHVGATQHCDQGIRAQASTRDTGRPPQSPTSPEHAGELRQRRTGVGQTVEPVIRHAQVKAFVLEGQRRHVGFDELDGVVDFASIRLSARQLKHVRRYVGRDISHRLARPQAAKGEAASAGNVEYRGPRRGFRKSRDLGEHASHVGTPQRTGADHCDTIVLDTGVVKGGRDTLCAPPLCHIYHRGGASGASQGIDAETQ
jgi:hypothetical protein